MFLTGIKMLKKCKNIIFGHIGVYWVRSWQKLTAWFARRTFINWCQYWHTRGRCFCPESKSSKSTKIWFLDILECSGRVHGRNSLHDSCGELLSINTDIATRGCEVIYRNQKVQRARKYDFLTYWSVLGEFMTETHFATRAANFCELMPILPHLGAKLNTGIKKFKKHENMISWHIGLYWVRSWQKLTSLLARRTFLN